MSESRIDKQKRQKNREKQEEEGALKQTQAGVHGLQIRWELLAIIVFERSPHRGKAGAIMCRKQTRQKRL